jgi:esterase
MRLNVEISNDFGPAGREFYPMTSPANPAQRAPTMVFIHEFLDEGRSCLSATAWARKSPSSSTACLDRIVALVLLTPVPLGGMELPPEVASTLRGLGAHPEAHRDVRAQLAGPLAQPVLEDLAAAGRKVREQVVAALFDAWSAGVSAGSVKTEVGCPILLVGGTNDPFVTPELLESVVKPRFPGAALTFVSDAGHWPHVERPDAAADIVATFLAALTGPGA